MVQTHCPHCNAVFIHSGKTCPKCGAAIPLERKVDACEGGARSAAPWQPRLAAYVFDLLLFVLVAGAALNFVFGPSFGTVITASVLIYIYFVAFDFQFGRTPGKMFMGLEIRRMDGQKLEARDAAIESTGKVPFLLPIDLIAGIYAARCDGLRYMNHIAGTTVVRKEKEMAGEERSEKMESEETVGERRSEEMESEETAGKRRSEEMGATGVDTPDTP